MKSITWITLSLSFAGIAGSVYSLKKYRSVFDGNLSESHEAWAQFGDYLSGTIGAVLAFVSFIALLYTIYTQSKQMQETTTEIRSSRAVQEQALDLTRLNALLSMRAHYIETIAKWNEAAEKYGMHRNDGYMQEVQNAVIDATTKLGEVNTKLNGMYPQIMADLNELHSD